LPSKEVGCMAANQGWAWWYAQNFTLALAEQFNFFSQNGGEKVLPFFMHFSLEMYLKKS
jgi:hypothetical protein